MNDKSISLSFILFFFLNSYFGSLLNNKKFALPIGLLLNYLILPETFSFHYIFRHSIIRRSKKIKLVYSCFPSKIKLYNYQHFKKFIKQLNNFKDFFLKKLNIFNLKNNFLN